MASARHDRLPWTVGVRMGPTPFEDDVWELYNLNEDFSQANDLAAERPETLRELQTLFMQEAQSLGILPLRSSLDSKTPMPSLTGDRTQFTYYPGAVGIPETGAPAIANRSWGLQASLAIADAQDAAMGVIATMGGTTGGWSLYLDAGGRPVFEYRVFELGHIRIVGEQRLPPGQHTLQLQFDYDGGGYAKGGTFTLQQDGQPLGEGRVVATPPAFFSIDETFDIGVDTGSPAGRYPQDVAPGYAFRGGTIRSVNVQLQ
jgi:arylsulfatase